jgi:hypothetical protein
MVFGDPTNEGIQLNENTVGSGERHFHPQPESSVVVWRLPRRPIACAAPVN